MKIITESNWDIITEESDDKKDLFVKGIFSSANIRNNNGRVYRKDVLVRESDKMIEKVQRKSLWGELSHPPSAEINPDRIAIRVDELTWHGDHLHGKAKLLDTPMGKIAKTLVKEGTMGISSRGLGTVDEDGYVNDDYEIRCWDLVVDPSNNPSWVKGIYEGLDFCVGKEQEQNPKLSRQEAEDMYYKLIMEFIERVKKNI